MPSPRGFLIIVLSTVVVALSWGLGCSEEYDRYLFRHWIDEDKDGFNTREEVLISTSISVVIIDEDNKIVHGTWLCPYTGTVTHDPRTLDIDHIVPLQWAWKHGANEWDSDRRKAFANDGNNLIAVVSRINRVKGAKGPSAWLPPNLYFGHTYINRFVSVIERYQLRCPGDCYQSRLEALTTLRNGILLDSPLFGE